MSIRNPETKVGRVLRDGTLVAFGTATLASCDVPFLGGDDKSAQEQLDDAQAEYVDLEAGSQEREEAAHNLVDLAGDDFEGLVLQRQVEAPGESYQGSVDAVWSVMAEITEGVNDQAAIDEARNELNGARLGATPNTLQEYASDWAALQEHTTGEAPSNTETLQTMTQAIEAAQRLADAS